jgi:hypothetical protein
MKVGAWEWTESAGWVRLSTRIEWEDVARAPETLYLEWRTDAAGVAAAVTPEPDAALLMTYPLAMALGERRLVVEGMVSPRLADGSRAVMAMIARARSTLHAVHLELTEGYAPVAAHDRVAAVCLSGGVDALAALQANLRDAPQDHPARFRLALFVFGLNTYDHADGRVVPAREAAAWEYADRLESFARSVGLSLVRVRTNLRTMYPSFESWISVTFDSHLAAVGQAMRTQIRSLGIGSSGAALTDGLPQDPRLLPFHSTHAVDVYGTQNMVPRLEKLRALLAWPEAMAQLRVCFLLDVPAPGTRNCGRCEKCVRTMLQCIALGAEHSPPARGAFTQWVDVAAVDALTRGPKPPRGFYAALAPLLTAQGRADLAAAVRRVEPS